MIQLNRPDKPISLRDNGAGWTSILLKKCAKLSTIDPKDKDYAFAKKEVDTAEKHYDQPDIREALHLLTTGNIASGKCVYCETFITAKNISDIEHFEPKSLYPEHCYEWNNLLLSCAGCNRPPGKGTHDTRNFPIVNPTTDDPAAYFTYRESKITVKDDAIDTIIAQRTIDVCKLRRIGLRRSRFEISNSFEGLKIALKSEIQDYNRLVQKKAKQDKAEKIYNCLQILKEMGVFNRQYAGYMRDLITKSNALLEAVIIVNEHKTDLGLVESFSWTW
jgi:uncharacterized protein (TIGR02646 family)